MNQPPLTSARRPSNRLARFHRKHTRIITVTLFGALAPIGLALGLTLPSGSAAASFPTATNRGVPAGVTLTPYAGPLNITSCGAVLDGVIVNGDLTVSAGNGTHSAATPCVTIRNSLIKGIVDDKWTARGFGPVVMTDSEIANPTARDVAAISDTNYYVWRSYIHGARSGGQCDGYCEIRDSMLVADTESGSAHMDAFISNGNYGAPMLLDHNSLLCQPSGSVPNGSGCAADLGLFGDFSAITNVTVTNNLFMAPDAYYCVHSGYEPSKPFPNGGNINFTGNTFARGSSGKCGDAGPVYSWANSAGTWCNNTYDNGGNVLSTPDNCPTGTTTTKAPTTTVQATTTTKAPTTTTVAPTTTTTKPTTPTTECLHTVPKVCTITP